MTKTRFLPTLLLTIFLAAPGFALAQSGGDAVEIMVWVHDKDEFVNDLTLDDFEIYEDGKLQRAGTLHLVREKSIVREGAPGPAAPDLPRNFYLIYQTLD